MSGKAALQTEEIEELIVDFVRTELAGEQDIELDSDENLLMSGVVDSVGIVRLIAHLKRELGVTVPPGDLVPANFRTVRIMATYMQGRQGES
jgi:acyl carrier protein